MTIDQIQSVVIGLSALMGIGIYAYIRDRLTTSRAGKPTPEAQAKMDEYEKSLLDNR